MVDLNPGWTASWVDVAERAKSGLEIHRCCETMVLAFHDFWSHFRAAKYATVLLQLQDPLFMIVSCLTTEEPPSDVMIATLSGCLQTGMDQMAMLKKGRNKNELFVKGIKAASSCLTKFVTVLQEGIRVYAHTQEIELHRAETVDMPPEPATQSKRLSVAPLRGLHDIIDKISDFSQPPPTPSWMEVLRSLPTTAPFWFFLSVALLCVAIGTACCHLYYACVETNGTYMTIEMTFSLICLVVSTYATRGAIIERAEPFDHAVSRQDGKMKLLKAQSKSVLKVKTGGPEAALLNSSDIHDMHKAQI